jgi:hypothetical protein
MPPVTVIDDWGNPHTLEGDALQAALDRGWAPENDGAAAARIGAAAVEESYSGLGDKIDAYGAGVARGFTGGLSDAGLAAIGGAGTKRHLRNVQAANPVTSGLGEVVGGVTGAVTGVGPAGSAATLGARIAKAGEGAGALTRIGRAAAGSAVEGAAMGFGSGLSELALSEDPLTTERAFSTLSSRTIYGGAIGAGAGTIAKGAELGLLKGKAALDDVAAKYSQRAAIGDDLASLDAKGLHAAEKVEREAIEASRVTQRSDLATEITAFRRELKAQKQFLLTKDVDLPAVGEKLGAKELGKIAFKANKQLDNILDNPVGVAKNPAKALDALQRQENALAKLAERSDDLRAVFAADTSGQRLAALDTVAPALERNRALQQRIAAVSGEASSDKLTRIAEAKLALSGGGGPKSMAEQMAGGTVFSAVTGAVAAVPVVGPFLAPMIGARAANVVTDKVFGRLGKAMTERQARTATALGKVFEKGARAVKAAPPVATRVLGAVAFAPSREVEESATPARQAKLPALYRKRTQELREQVQAGPVGKPVVRQAARARIAASLAPIAAFQPLLADRMESLAVRRLEFLAERMPKRPEMGGIQIGPDNWQPSDMEMRAWARLVAAAEDPDGILERVASGEVSPEDAEVMRELYPEQLADITRQILERLPTLRQNLPYHRRLALSVLTGVPVDPSMDPRILAVLQQQFAAEPEPPKATPQFGSVSAKNEVGTLSERRERGT